MKQKILNIIVALSLIFVPAGLLTTTAYADCSGNSSVGQVLTGVGQTTNDCTGNGVTSIVGTAVRILSYVAGIAAIIMIIVSGFRYMTSGGEANRVASAKNTLIYAAIGIVVAALAQLLVNVVITQSGKVVCPAHQHLDSKTQCVND